MNTQSVSKLRTALLACAVAATALASTSHAFAQGQVMVVKVPFAFHSASQQLPAGTYKIEIQSDHLILLRGASRSGYVMTNPTIGKTANTGKVVFERYGDQYFLREVWAQGSVTGQQCVKGRLEKEVELAGSRTAPSSFAVALNRLPR